MTIGKLLVLVTAVFPLVIAFWWKKRIDDFSQICVEDPLVVVFVNDSSSSNSNNNNNNNNTLTKIQPCHVFSSSYQQARTRFREATQRIDGVELVSLPVVTTGHQDETMDIAVLPGDLPGLIIHSSGTHGVEGFAGSAIQIAYLMQAAAAAGNNKTRGAPTVILIHAINPWAMARFRRTNENNVDLNRNALTPEQWELARHHVNHAAYQTFHTLFNPPQPPLDAWSHVSWFLLQAVPLVLQHGTAAIKAALVGGQYYDPKGVSYGGSGKLEASWLLLEEWMTEFLATRKERHADDIVTWLDIHTGLGDLGVDTFLFHPAAYPNMEQVQAVVEDVVHHFPEMQTPLAGVSQHATHVMQGYDNTMGLSTTYFLKLFTSKQKPLLGAQEFGTVPSLFVADALFRENAARHHLSVAEGLAYAQRTTKRVFYPDHVEWRRQVLTRGLRVLGQALRRSSSSLPQV